MANKWNDFHENMGDQQAALHMSGAFDSTVGHDHDPTLPGRGAQISYNSLKDKPTSIANATNATTNINGQAITDIFEQDGITVKNATNAALAEAAKGDTRFQVSGHYVLPSPLTLSGSGYYLGSVFRLLPAHKSIKIVRAVFSFPGFDVNNVQLIVRHTYDSMWYSLQTAQGDETPNFVIQTNPTDSPVNCYLEIGVFSASMIQNTAGTGNIFSWWLDLAIEDV